MIFAWLRVARFLTLFPLEQFPRQLDPLLPPPHRFHSHGIGQLLASSKAKHICWPESGARKVDTNSKQKVSIIAEEAGQEFNWQLIELGKHHCQCQVATIQSLMASPTIQACSSQRQIVFCIIWIWIWIIWIILANTTGSAKWQVPAIRFLLASLTVTFLHLSVSASVNMNGLPSCT